MTSKSKSKDDEWSYNFHEDSSQETSSQELERLKTASTLAQLFTTNKNKTTNTNLTEEEILIAEAEAQDDDNDFTFGLNDGVGHVDIIDIGMVKEGNIKVSDNPFTKAKVIGRMKKRNREDDGDSDEVVRARAKITPSIPITKSPRPSKTIENPPNRLQQGFARQAEVYATKPKKKSSPAGPSSKPKRIPVALKRVPEPSPTKGTILKPSPFQTALKSLTSHRPLDVGSSSSPIRSSTASSSPYVPKFASYKLARPFSAVEKPIEEIDDSDGETDSTSIFSMKSTTFTSPSLITSNNSSSPSSIARISPIKLLPPSKPIQPIAPVAPAHFPKANSSVRSSSPVPETQTRRPQAQLILFSSNKSKPFSPPSSPIASTSKFTLPGLIPSVVGAPKVLFKPTESLNDYKARIAKEEQMEEEVIPTFNRKYANPDIDRDGIEEKIVFGTTMRAFKPSLSGRKRSLPRRIGEVGKRSTQAGEKEGKEGQKSLYGNTFDW